MKLETVILAVQRCWKAIMTRWEQTVTKFFKAHTSRLFHLSQVQCHTLNKVFHRNTHHQSWCKIRHWSCAFLHLPPTLWLSWVLLLSSLSRPLWRCSSQTQKRNAGTLVLHCINTEGTRKAPPSPGLHYMHMCVGVLSPPSLSSLPSSTNSQSADWSHSPPCWHSAQRLIYCVSVHT